MFGEEIIVTNRLLKLDPKRRLRIPSETKVEVGEKIYPMFDIRREYLLLLNEQDLLIAIKKYEDLFKSLREEGKIDARKYREFLRHLYATLCFVQEIVDKQNRIIIPQIAINRMQLSNTVYAVGKNTHLELYKDEETYQAILARRK